MFFDIAEVEVDESFIFAALFIVAQSNVEFFNQLFITFFGVDNKVILAFGMAYNLQAIVVIGVSHIESGSEVTADSVVSFACFYCM